MKFKKLYEEYTSDDLYQELIDYIYEKLLVAVDNLAMQAASDIAEYDPDYCSEEPNNYSMEADNKLRQAAEYFAEFLLKEAPEIIHEDVKGRPFDAPETIGKLNPGDKFKNRNGVEIIIIEPQKDGIIQYKIGDEVRAGSEKSIQRMLYVNNYLREDYKDTDLFKKGQKVLYNGKETFIKEIDNDPKYGIDLLVKNPDWDGKDERFEYIWVADNVEVI